MRQVNLRGVDLNLLVILEKLLETKHVSLAATQLHMSQPAVSRALQRLRELLNDPLLVRIAGDYELTERAAEIQRLLPSALATIQDVIAKPEFDPATAKETIRFSGPELEVNLYGPPLLKRMKQAAPGMKLELKSNIRNQFEPLENGEAHFVLSGQEPNAATSQLHRISLGRFSYVCLMSKDHPLTGKPISLDDYLAQDHISVMITGSGQSIIDDKLAAMGRKRNVAVKIGSFFAAMHFCGQTDLLFLVPSIFDKKIYEGHNTIAAPVPDFLKDHHQEFFLYWHERYHHDPMIQWTRTLMKETTRQYR
ncbi:transcriptional regulator, LysR family protein [Pseudovibrio sp. FO-BEG1]|uniref:LysR family transcriptional regulator n=1 Tax=Pseudovibrio sp. (strain FO-BEG1) TaxID=911045 RepID=UPI000238C6C6|nr:LysR family transcriptional regulator [Pseudovibrio sp. FO-BEG1]AEV35507.1 transcriptional regulator, LysR family protein [Pseudovibrio sp. FO-BEG1]